MNHQEQWARLKRYQNGGEREKTAEQSNWREFHRHTLLQFDQVVHLIEVWLLPIWGFNALLQSCRHVCTYNKSKSPTSPHTHTHTPSCKTGITPHRDNSSLSPWEMLLILWQGIIRRVRTCQKVHRPFVKPEMYVHTTREHFLMHTRNHTPCLLTNICVLQLPSFSRSPSEEE